MADSANFSANGTKLTNVINPQVLADMVEKKLTNAIKFAPLAVIDTTLEGTPGNTLTLPSWNYIGDASAVDEAADIPIAQLTASTATATIHKLGRGVELTDEAVLSGYGDPIGQAAEQLALSIAAGEDNEMLTTLRNIAAGMTKTFSGTVPTADDIADALELFGEDIEGEKVILVSPATYTALRKSDDWVPASDVAANLIINGTVGMVHGCQVVVSNKLAKIGDTTSNDAYIVKPGALRIITKRGTLVETDRDIVAKFTVITADKHFVTYLYDASKAVKLVKNP